MIRIRGRIGDWPVELDVELDPGDWAQLGQHLAVVEAEAQGETVTAAPARPSSDDPLWPCAQDLLRQAGQLSGPQLLEQLEPLAGSIQAAKRLLVRLRHCSQVCIEQQGEAALYRWRG